MSLESSYRASTMVPIRMKKKIVNGSRLQARKKPPNKRKNIETRPREYLTPQEVILLVDDARRINRHGFRNAAIIVLMYRHALRVSELTKLKWNDVDLEHGRLYVRRINRGISAMHDLGNDEIQILQQLRAAAPSRATYVFISQRNTTLTTRTVHNIITTAAQSAGIGFSVHPHMLRHSRAYELKSNGADAKTIQLYLGHRNLQSTHLYRKSDAHESDPLK